MVAKHSYGDYIYGLLTYNEDKVQEGQAKLVYGENFPAEVADLDKRQKYEHFKNFTSLNTRVKKNAEHFTLNFHKDDTPLLTEEKLKDISLRYMSGLGLEGQPFLVYQHFDANHPHLHIVTTNINEEGKRINVFRAVQQHSEETRRGIEKEYGIIIADGREPLPPKKGFERPLYGKAPTCHSIESTIDHTLEHYSPSNLGELETLLNAQGIVLARGGKGSEHRNNDGLVYGIMGRDGKQQGVGIKASRLSNTPTIKTLQTTFEANKSLKRKTFKEVARAVNTIYYEHLHLKEKGLTKKLSVAGIYLIPGRDENGTIKSLSYIHKATGTLFRASEFRLEEKKFIAKITGHDLTYDQAGGLNRKLSKIYRNGHRATRGYESTYLQNVSSNELATALSETEHAHPLSTLQLVATSFLDYKNRQRDAIFEKDLSRFNKYAVPLVRYAQKMEGLNLNEKRAFLANFDIGAKQDGEASALYSISEPTISMVQSGPVPQVLNAPAKGKNRTVGKLSPHEKKVIRFLAERYHGHLNRPVEILSLRYKSKNLDGLIDAKSLNFLDRQVTMDYRDRFVQFVGENPNKIGLDLALEYGLLVEPLERINGRWTYAVRAHRCARIGSIPAGRELTELFNTLGLDRAYYDGALRKWGSDPNSLSLEHSLVNELHRMEVTANHSDLMRIVERTAHYKPQLVKQLHREIGGLSEPATLNNISILQLREKFIELLKNPEKNKHPYPLYAEPNKSSYTNSPQFDRDWGYLSISDDDEEELRRKKLLRKFYAELER